MPGDAWPRMVLDALRRLLELTDDLFGRDPEMSKDGADDQWGDDDLDQGPKERVQHPRPIMAARVGG